MSSMLREFLIDKFVETRYGFTSFHQYPYLKKCGRGDSPVSQNLSEQIIYFPTLPYLEGDDMN
jgi:dTDP-4-amino-4,6-dideoxygalactose transaminase